MQSTANNSSLHNQLPLVKSQTFNTLSTPPKPMIHHKDYSNTYTIIYKNKGKRVPKPYGVSSSHKVLTKGLLLKKWDLVVRCLKENCELTPAERDVALEFLRFQAYYPEVYPKATQVALEVNRGVATFWRTVGKLQDMNLLEVYQRFLIRPEAQISNLYLLKGLVLLLARYLAEHGVAFRERWLTRALTMPGRLFWRQIYQAPEAQAAPGILAYSGP